MKSLIVLVLSLMIGAVTMALSIVLSLLSMCLTVVLTPIVVIYEWWQDQKYPRY